MTDADKTEAKVTKHVDEAAAKFKGLRMASNTPEEHDARARDILMSLALRCALAGPSDQCRECDDKLDPRVRERCPKHVGLMLAADYAKAKAKEHGPVLMAKAAMGLQAWFEKLTADEGKESGEKGEEKGVGKT